ncbi:NGFI-A-binding protein 1-like isoform X2 [Gigantopelta aegis]|uniref:NGFI-A-binding protein 1-like isoform X2 n=1 Tax=Gigantopelta aegis TaxID=1735272 RepID=UPI001B889092|nr:NGFI-A-binding protein 1-like isoform X2 [Gigantopelta aegis]
MTNEIIFLIFREISFHGFLRDLEMNNGSCRCLGRSFTCDYFLLMDFRHSEWNFVTKPWHCRSSSVTGPAAVAMATSQPTNSSEWQLYRVLQRANLLQYYETFIAQGGDDVQQLCEAGEEEFLEIMALVGMASKPLHVRRLQKALQDWVQNPQDTSFQGSTSLSANPAPGSITAVARDQLQALGFSLHSTPPSSVVTAPSWSPQSPQPSVSPGPRDTRSPSSNSPQQNDVKDVSMIDDFSQGVCGYSLAATSQHSPSPVSGVMCTPVLVESQINAIAVAAEKLAKELPPFEPKELNMKKQINRDIQTVMRMTDENPNRLEELRKYAAIYGRFDSKRKNDRPMSLHEISVNEAAAQLCRHMPALITRREDLFPLARQVVKDSGYQYSKGHSRLNPERQELHLSRAADMVVSSKKPRLDPVFQRNFDAYRKNVKPDIDRTRAKERITAINHHITQLKYREEDIKIQINVARKAEDKTLVSSLHSELETAKAKHIQLLTEQSKIVSKLKQLERYEQLSSDPDSSLSSSNSHDLATSVLRQTANKLVQETLFDEGLRIAQQYGMADFAEELKGLQTQKTPSNHDEGDSESDNSCSPTPSDDENSNSATSHNNSNETMMTTMCGNEKDDLIKKEVDVDEDEDENEEDVQIRENGTKKVHDLRCNKKINNVKTEKVPSHKNKAASQDRNGDVQSGDDGDDDDNDGGDDSNNDIENDNGNSTEKRSKLPSLGFSTDLLQKKMVENGD